MGPARWARGHGSREGADRLGGWGLGRGPHWPPLARVALSWSSTTVGFGFTRFSWSLVPGSWDFSVFFLFHFLGLGCPVWERPECNGYCSEMLVAVFLICFVFYSGTFVGCRYHLWCFQVAKSIQAALTFFLLLLLLLLERRRISVDGVLRLGRLILRIFCQFYTFCLRYWYPKYESLHS